MSRKMYITDDMGIDRGLTKISKSCTLSALIWPWLVPYFDDWGRAEADPERIKGKVFPLFPELTVEVIREAVYHLSSVGILTIYAHDEEWLMAVEPEKWFRYQSHIRGEKRENDKSQYPAPDNYNGGDYAEYRASARDCAGLREVDVKIALPLGNGNTTVTVTPPPTPPRTGSARARAVVTFIAPSRQEVREYLASLTPPMTVDQADSMFLHYEERDWKQSNGKKIRDWKLTAQRWHLNNKPGGRFYYANGNNRQDGSGPRGYTDETLANVERLMG